MGRLCATHCVSRGFLPRDEMQHVTLPDIEFELRPEVHQRLLKTAVTRVQLLRLAMRGMHASEAAKQLGIHAVTARGHYADPSFRREVLGKVEGAFADIDNAFTEKQKTLHERLEEQAAKSFEELVALADQDDLHPALKVKIHQDFLNRTDESKPLTGHTTKIDPTWLHHAAGVAKEMDKVIEIRKSA